MAQRRKYTKEFLQPYIESNTSFAGIIKALGLKLTGGSYRHIQQRVREYGFDTSHFLGSAWAKGKNKNSDEKVFRASQKLRTPNEEVFKENSGFNPSRLSKRLIELGWEKKCAICELQEWLGKPIRLHVDHINGEHTDHRLDNLRFLCPNCHQQTDTWGNSMAAWANRKNRHSTHT